MVKDKNRYYQPQHKWYDARSFKHQLLPFALSAVEDVAEDSGGGGLLSGGLGLLTGGLSGLFGGGGGQQSAPQQGGGGSIAPQVQHYGPFGLLTSHTPGLVSAPNPPTYANTLQFGPIAQAPQAPAASLTPMSPLAPLPGPAAAIPNSGGSRGGSSMQGPAPQAISSGGGQGAGPVIPQMPFMPQQPQEPASPYAAPDSGAQQQIPQPAPQYQAPAAPAGPQLMPWQQSAMGQMQQAGISPASFGGGANFSAFPITAADIPGPPPGNGASILSPQEGGPVQGQRAVPANFVSNATPTLPTQGGVANLVAAAQGYPAMLGQSLQGAMDNVNAFNDELKNGTKQIEAAAEAVKQGIMQPAEEEVQKELGSPIVQADGKQLNLPEYRQYLRGAIQAGNEDVDRLQTEYQNAGITGQDRQDAQDMAASFTGKTPSKLRGGFAKWVAQGFEMSALGRQKGAIADEIAMRQQQIGQLEHQAQYLDSRVDVIRNRYQAAQALANKTAQDMRNGYYQLANALTSGVKGINELQAQNIRGFIADQQHQSQIEQMQQSNELTAQKIQNEADQAARKNEIDAQKQQFEIQNAGSKARQAAESDKVKLVNELISKMPSGTPPAVLSKALKQFMDQVSVEKAGQPEGTLEAKK